MELEPINGYQRLVGQISEAYTQGRVQAFRVVNTQLLETYWQIGRAIVEFEQGGEAKAEYGKALLANLSKDLTARLGKGFSRSNLTRFRQFYLVYPNRATLSHKLTWSHVIELLKIEHDVERSFYWSWARASPL